GMRKLPELGAKLDVYRQNAVTNVARQAEYQAELKKFVPTEKPEWATPAFEPDAAWKSVAKVASFTTLGLGGFDGAAWFRAEVEVPANLAGQDAKLKLGTIDDDDRTYFNGKMVGETEGWDIQRNYSITLKAGKNLVAVRALDGAGEGGFAGEQFIEVGGQKLPLSNWRYLPIVNPNRPPQPNYLPSAGFSTLYNGMIAPLAPFAMRGALWYQGESNVSRAEQYQRSFPNMIQDWRNAWGNDISFYFVQIAPFAYQPAYGPELREAQGYALKMKKTGMVLTTDLVDSLTNIHPVKKREVADRLAGLALFNDYGQGVSAYGPTFKALMPMGRAVRVSFNNAAALKGTGEGFQVAGKDGVYCDATARIEADSVVVESIQVANPVSVRYGWSDTMLATLWNGAGLPMVPFRTDSLPLFTKGVRW
ncbi:MAG: sialate O-acetylesterase, partial [Fimbriimonadaceae bacterium]